MLPFVFARLWFRVLSTLSQPDFRFGIRVSRLTLALGRHGVRARVMQALAWRRLLGQMQGATIGALTFRIGFRGSIL